VTRGRPSRWISLLGGLVGGVYLLLGIAEALATSAESASMVLWVLLLCGGALVLYGIFGRGGVSPKLVTVGALAGIVGSALTLIVPVAAIVLVVLVYHDENRPSVAP
jgi:hypothetical protein